MAALHTLPTAAGYLPLCCFLVRPGMSAQSHCTLQLLAHLPCTTSHCSLKGQHKLLHLKATGSPLPALFPNAARHQASNVRPLGAMLLDKRSQRLILLQVQ